MFQFDPGPNDLFFVFKNFFHFFADQAFMAVLEIKVYTGENQVVLHMRDWVACLWN